jgi:hypothetical protein
MPESVTLTVNAGPRARRNAVVCFPLCGVLPQGADPAAVAIEDTTTGAAVAAQIDPDCCAPRVYWVVDELAADATRDYVLRLGEAASSEHTVAADLIADDRVDFTVAATPFTSYVFREGIARPYLYPVIGPGGVEVTACGPSDHVHHRSIYIAQGEVNDFDNWSEQEGHASTVNREISLTTASGPVFAELCAKNDWVSPKGGNLLHELTTVRVYARPDCCRMIDVSSSWIAQYGGVHFGSTKEAGTLSVRVAADLEVKNGGKIENSYGGVNEAETWGQRAAWCDYSGVTQGHHVGIAVFDHPENLRYPTHWHVRNYGLMTANQWGLSDFTADPSKRGDYCMRPGEVLSWRFRVYIHQGDAADGDVRRAYHDFINPPEVSP